MLGRFPERHAPEEEFLIGVSGGRDSVALLHLLLEAGFRRLIVCHLDHGLRAASGQDAEFVRELAATCGLPFMAAREDVQARAAREAQSIETAARAARYEFFAKIAAERNCPRLLLAHHADDRVETFLFNLLRGASTAGLSTLRGETRRVVAGIDLQIFRPLLEATRAEIGAYVVTHDVRYREDESNQELLFSRNRLRHLALPALESAMGREVRRAIWRAAETLAAENDWMESLPEMQMAEAQDLDASALAELPTALQRRVVKRWLTRHAILDAGFDDVEAVCRLFTQLRPAKVNLSGNWHARRRTGIIFLEGPNQ